MKKFQRIILSLALAGSTLLATDAHAQYTGAMGTQWNNPMSASISVYLQGQQQMSNLMASQMIARGSLASSMQSGKKYQPKRTTAEQKQIDAFAKYRGTMFKAKKSNAPATLAATFVKEPGQTRNDITKILQVMLDVYELRSKQQKAPANDLARTLAYCIAANYAYYNEREVSAAGLSALRGKIRQVLVGDKGFRAMSDANKQKLSDTMVILTHLAAVGYDQSKEAGETEAMKGYKQLAGITLQSILGVAPNRVKLDKTGLVISAA